MKILVTGKSGFLARSIKHSFLSKKYNTVFVGREDLSLLNKDQVKTLLSENKFDIIFHTAVSGGKRNDIDTSETLDTNLRMFLNLAELKNKDCKLINFCSGAAFDRRREINCAKEEEISSRTPDDYYGLSKNIIANYINNFDKTFINLRIFGCFGKLENDNRFIKNSINNLKNNKNITIFKNKYMDFIYIEDLINILDYFVVNNSHYKDYNIVYKEKITLYDIAKKITSNLHLDESRIDILEPGLDSPYTGSSERIYTLVKNLNYNIDFGISSMIECF